ncbi:carboxypeptidase-like regulatory domain-containing protein [Kordia algicida OT-1]|uniref:TonB-dependent receptor n=1 Tax=Kordia algicida OT-1 TaxID=391587 RepID=A9E121_9FLAO|nr:carboxypeptidase-like regulatory domain-containing protein [Kordia algicida]EDP95571.1 hypothetical protein KAOT1_22006 [Kordia algicida OT-1]
MKKGILYCVTLFLLTACAKKVVRCALIGENMNPKKLQSVVTINENRLIADTTVVNVSGKVLGSYIHDGNDTITDILEYANVAFTNLKTQEVLGTTSKVDGLYNIFIPAATYNIEFQFIGYNRVIIENVKLDTSEIVNLSANLGQGIGKEYFEIRKHRANRELIRKTN